MFACLLLILLTSTSLFAERGISVRKKLQQNSGKTIGPYRALVIGINDYQDPSIPDLTTAVNDASVIASLLQDFYGFSEVKLLTDQDATASAILKQLRRLATKSKSEDSVLIYFAGHGDLDKITKDGWWIPHNAVVSDPSTYIDNAVIQKYIRAIPARHVLLVSDSCFSGTLFGNSRSLPPVINEKYYATLFKEKSRWGMTSGNLTPVADDGAGGHSLFAYQFIKSLKENQEAYLTPREIYQKIAPIISNNSAQIPITKPIRNADDRGGEFIFIRDKTGIPKTDKTTHTADAELELWKIIKNSNYIEDFQAYLSTYPSGKYVIHAKTKIRQLKRSQNVYAGGSLQTEEQGDGTINISTNPSRADIYLNNRHIGKGPISTQLKAGEYRIKVQKEGFKPETKTVTIKTNKRTNLMFILDNLGGQIDVTSNPEGAQILLNHSLYGITPFTIKGLQSGQYEITLKKEGYSDWRQTLFLQEGQNLSLSPRLNRIKANPDFVYDQNGGEVEVLHWWTSGGESKAFQELKEMLRQSGYRWKDFEGSGSNAMDALQKRVSGRNPPTAAQMKGPQIQIWGDKGVLANIDFVARKNQWDNILPAKISTILKHNNRYVAAPVAVHRVNWMYVNPAIFKYSGATIPTNWKEFEIAAKLIRAAGYIPVAFGGQNWQEATLFEIIVSGVGGPEFYTRSLVRADIDSLRSDTMIECLRILKIVKRYTDRGAPGRDWNVATDLVINERAAMFFMGDWAKGEFLNAGKTPDSDFVCADAPGNKEGYIFNLDSFVMFDQPKNSHRRAQNRFSELLVGENFQLLFNKHKGSIPVRLGTSLSDFDKCAVKSMSDYVAASSRGTLLPSMAHGMAVYPDIKHAIYEVITNYYNSNQSAISAARDLANAVAAAK